MDYNFILASGSPRRCEILNNIGIKFSVLKSNADESQIDSSKISTELFVEELAVLKATATLKFLDGEYLVIGADTVVYYDGKILGKPKDEQDAVDMLKMLSGKTHSVYTGVAVIRSSDMMTVSKCEKTDVTFAELSDEEILSYVKTGEPLDKAGAYGIQGLGSTLIKKINGDYFNVVGLPVRLLTEILKDDFDYSVL